MATRTERGVGVRTRAVQVAVIFVGVAALAVVAVAALAESAGGGAQRGAGGQRDKADRQEVVGRITAVGGTTFTVAEPDGRTTTVTTSKATTFLQRAAVDLDGATIGRLVSARGADTELGFVADLFAVRPAPGDASAGREEGIGDGDDVVVGTLKSIDADAGIATLETGDGIAVVVLTPATRVVESGAASMYDVVPGAPVRVEGTSPDYAIVDADLVVVGAPRTVQVTSTRSTR